MKRPYLLVLLTLLAGTACAETGRPADIPEAGRIRIDGHLEDWGKIDWVPLDKNPAGNPVNISNAQWALRWDDGAMLYIAVRYDDVGIVLQDHYVNSNAQDCVEIFVRGDTGSQPIDYSENQSSAQHYIFGLSKNKTAVWKKLGAEQHFPSHNPATASVLLNGNTFTCEIMVPLYDKFSIRSRRECRITEVFPELETGADIVIVDVSATGYAGRKAENMMPGKRSNADHIAEHTLSE